MSSEQKVVLLVDDDVFVRNLIRRNLESEGFQVFSAAGAGEAITLARACADPIDVAVIDVELPDGDGIAVAEAILRERPRTAILLISGGTSLTVPEHMSFIAKPFSRCELTDALTRALAHHSARSERIRTNALKLPAEDEPA